jgi:hypothetical protein
MMFDFNRLPTHLAVGLTEMRDEAGLLVGYEVGARPTDVVLDEEEIDFLTRDAQFVAGFTVALFVTQLDLPILVKSAVVAGREYELYGVFDLDGRMFYPVVATGSFIQNYPKGQCVIVKLTESTGQAVNLFGHTHQIALDALPTSSMQVSECSPCLMRTYLNEVALPRHSA